MKRFLKVLLILVIVIIVAIGGLLAYVKTALPNVGDAPDLKITSTPEMVERGRYLANHVMLCVDCHSERDWETFSAPIVEGTYGQGGEVFDQSLGFPGKYVAPNISPYGLESWTDGEIFRAVTSGVSKDGRALFPIMPHPNFGQLDSNDIYAVIAYIRTLPAKEHKTGISISDFPMNFIINTIPKKPSFVTRPDPGNKVAYGKYLVTAASCETCHTDFLDGKFVGEPFAGGREFPMPGGSILRSANITPHPSGSMAILTEETFVQKFTQYADSSYVPKPLSEVGYQTIMPWTMYAKMTNEDLAAIYAYLKTVAPVDKTVEKFTSGQQ